MAKPAITSTSSSFVRKPKAEDLIEHFMIEVHIDQASTNDLAEYLKRLTIMLIKLLDLIM